MQLLHNDSFFETLRCTLFFILEKKREKEREQEREKEMGGNGGRKEIKDLQTLYIPEDNSIKILNIEQTYLRGMHEKSFYE